MVDFRVRMFREMGWSDETTFDTFAPRAAEHLREGFAAGTCNGFIAEETAEDGARSVVGTVSLVWQRVAPSVRNLDGRQVYVLGMFVAPERRRRGIARALISACVACATEGGAPLISLHASDEGRPLYEQLGFIASSEMRRFTEHAGPAAWTPAYDAD